MLRISVDATGVSGTLALISGLKPPHVKKIFTAYKQIAKINQKQLPDTPGPRESFFLLNKMDYPYSAIGLIVMTAPISKIQSYCTGWLVSPKLVITAGHCVYDLDTQFPIFPEFIRFMPRVWGGKTNADAQHPDGYKVKAVSFPGWYEAMGREPHCSMDIRKWDVGVVHLAEEVPCIFGGCFLRPAIIVGKYTFTNDIRLAGYGKPAPKKKVMNVSNSCMANLQPNMAYNYNKCASYSGHSGAPYWPSPKTLPTGLNPFSWPAFGVHSARTPSGANAIMCQFTHAHLKWLHRAGLKTALSCTVSDTGATNCAFYKFLAT
jgi:V8-like Glu-specific endopeptidase